ncbi:MAG TPA: hypothetical protein VHL08_02720 [Dongiaceae bacterium]|nr:hypothetical protein [Dongiaceae bacterium]
MADRNTSPSFIELDSQTAQSRKIDFFREINHLKRKCSRSGPLFKSLQAKADFYRYVGYAAGGISIVFLLLEVTVHFHLIPAINLDIIDKKYPVQFPFWALGDYTSCRNPIEHLRTFDWIYRSAAIISVTIFTIVTVHTVSLMQASTLTRSDLWSFRYRLCLSRLYIKSLLLWWFFLPVFYNRSRRAKKRALRHYIPEYGPILLFLLDSILLSFNRFLYCDSSIYVTFLYIFVMSFVGTGGGLIAGIYCADHFERQVTARGR